MNPQHKSYWLSTKQPLTFPPLSQDIDVDVAIVGAGITGLTAAVLLGRAGKSVAVLENKYIGHGTTGHTTGHLASLIDAEQYHIEKNFGEEAARLTAQSMMEAIDFIEQFSNEYCLDCSFERLPGYYYTEKIEDISIIEKEYESALRAGLPVELTESVPLPFPIKKALKIEGQGHIHAISYLNSLAQVIRQSDGQIYENTHVQHVEECEPSKVHTDHGTVSAREVVMATHTPLGINLLHTAIAPYRSYAIAVKINGPVPHGLFWDTEDPYNYIRRQPLEDGDVLIIGGKDHKTAHSSEEDHFERLLDYAHQHFDIREVLNRWSSQLYEPIDGLPFIGLSPQSNHVYIGTGYSGDGLPFGTLAGTMITDLILGHDNPYTHLYRPIRVNLAGAMQFISENLDVVKNFIADRLSIAEMEQIQQLSPGEGTVIKSLTQPIAAFRDTSGEIRTYSAVCRHMGCIIHWNRAEKTWDCPCHGARYNTQGEPVEGPAHHSLHQVDIPIDQIHAQ